jgi:hypothetical protein
MKEAVRSSETLVSLPHKTPHRLKGEPHISVSEEVNLLKPTGHVMHHQFNIQQLYALPTLY